MKILTVVGARPQFVKAAPVSAALAAAGLEEYLVHTGQHYDAAMSDVFFAELGLRPPDRNLGVGSGSHAVQTAAMLAGLETVLAEQRPRVVLVYGDTNSTLAAALAAAKLHLPIAHVEAGLRSFNRRMPEEINRVVVDVLSTLLFVPTETARANLAREGIDGARVIWTGDVMCDATRLFAGRALREPGILARLGLGPRRFVLATIHRPENTDHPARLRAIFEGLARVARHTRVILPLHPRTRARLAALNGHGLDGVEIIEPVGFLDMLRLEHHALVVATDSGGVQKEAFFQRVPCVTLRDQTEWVELLEAGWNTLVPPDDPATIAAAILEAPARPARDIHPYGDGAAARLIADALKKVEGEVQLA